MKIWICGINGHMGQAVLKQAAELGIEVVGGIDITPSADAKVPVYASFDCAPVMGDVIVDFSKPAGLDSLLRYAVKNKIPAVIATTGLDEAQLKAVDEASKEVALFRSGNMSIGIALLRKLARQAAEVLGDSFDV